VLVRHDDEVAGPVRTECVIRRALECARLIDPGTNNR